MRPRAANLLIVAALAASNPAAPWAAEPASPAVAVVPVQVPITGTRDLQVEAAVLRQLDRLRGQPDARGILVLQFIAAEDADAQAVSDFGRALELARFLTGDRLGGVKTVAFLPSGAQGHAVLVALACEEIAMPADAVLGPATSVDEPVDAALRAAYAEIAARRRTVPAAVAIGLLDPAARVARVSTDDGERFVLRPEVDAIRRDAVVLGVEELEPTPLALTGRRGRELGFVRLLARTPADLARGLGVPERSLAADPSLGTGWRPTLVALQGAITADVVGRTRTRLERGLQEGANLLCLRIDSAGGSPEQSLVLATWLAGLDPAKVRTVAFVDGAARGDAALVAAACDEIVMARDAVLGGEGDAVFDERQAEAVAAAWKAGVAQVRDRPWSLPVALAVPGLEVHRATTKAGGRVEHFTREEFDSRADRDAWQFGPAVGTGPLLLDAPRAESLGVATHVVDGFAGLRQAYGLEADLAPPREGWAERLLGALASPGLAWILLMIGGAGLYIELKTPGFGFGGFVALVAFIVYFWSQYLHGTSGWLEVMLFIAGVICVAAEILVLPGFGVLGLGGGLLVIASIVLASQSFVIPANDYQIRQMQWSLAGILAAVAGVSTLAFLLRHWLPATPLLRDVLLVPPDDVAFGSAGEPPEDLVGAEGVTTSRLAPAGTARIDGRVREVTADSGLVEPGTAVRVVRVVAGRIHVRPAS